MRYLREPGENLRLSKKVNKTDECKDTYITQLEGNHYDNKSTKYLEEKLHRMLTTHRVVGVVML